MNGTCSVCAETVGTRQAAGQLVALVHNRGNLPLVCPGTSRPILEESE